MGADLSVCIEMQNKNGTWSLVAYSDRIYRGYHDEVVHRAGRHGIPEDTSLSVCDILNEEETPYWACWFPGLEFVHFGETHFDKVVPSDADLDDDTVEPEGLLFETDGILPALAAMVHELMKRRPTRVICWYGQ